MQKKHISPERKRQLDILAKRIIWPMTDDQFEAFKMAHATEISRQVVIKYLAWPWLKEYDDKELLSHYVSIIVFLEHQRGDDDQPNKNAPAPPPQPQSTSKAKPHIFENA